MRAFGHHRLQTPPDFLFVVSANLKASLSQFGAKSFDVGLHPQRNECLPVADFSTVLAVEQNPASSEVVHATADRTKGDIGLRGEDAVWRVDEFGTYEEGHDCFDPTLLGSTWGRGRFLGWLTAFHVNEQPRSLQVSVACQIEVIDAGAFQGGSLLATNVRGKKQEPVVNVVRGQIRPPTVQLINDDADVLVAKMAFLLDEIANDLPVHFPSDHGVEAVEWPRGCTDLGPRHPVLKNWLVQVEGVWTFCIDHVLINTTFINNEQT